MLLKVIHNVIRSTLSLPVYTCRCILVYLSRNWWRCDDIMQKDHAETTYIGSRVCSWNFTNTNFELV